MNLKQTLGKNIKQYRQLKGLSQEELAEKLDVSQQTMSKIERGINFLTSETLEKISNILGVKISELFTFEDDTTPDEIIDDINKYLNLLKTNPKKLAYVYKLVKESVFL